LAGESKIFMIFNSIETNSSTALKSIKIEFHQTLHQTSKLPPSAFKTNKDAANRKHLKLIEFLFSIFIFCSFPIAVEFSSFYLSVVDRLPKWRKIVKLKKLNFSPIEKLRKHLSQLSLVLR
jgi:hypothetical protein